MKVKLLRDARIKHLAGEVVTVSPAEYHFLVSTGSAVEVAVNPPAKVETPEEPKTVKTEKKTKRK